MGLFKSLGKLAGKIVSTPFQATGALLKGIEKPVGRLGLPAAALAMGNPTLALASFAGQRMLEGANAPQMQHEQLPNPYQNLTNPYQNLTNPYANLVNPYEGHPGLEQLATNLEPIYKKKATAPMDYLNEIMQRYASSPGVDYRQNKLLQGMHNTQAAGGYVGTAESQREQADFLNALMNEDMQQYLGNVMGIQGTGAQEYEGLLSRQMANDVNKRMYENQMKAAPIEFENQQRIAAPEFENERRANAQNYENEQRRFAEQVAYLNAMNRHKMRQLRMRNLLNFGGQYMGMPGLGSSLGGGEQ